MKRIKVAVAVMCLTLMAGTAFTQNSGNLDETQVPRPSASLSSGQTDLIRDTPGNYEPFVVEGTLSKPEGFGRNNLSTRDALDSKGTEFWLMFPANYYQVSVYVDITSDVNASGTVAVPGLGFSTPFTVVANTVTRVNLPINSMVTAYGSIEAKGIHITSDVEINVYGMNRAQYTTDGFLGLPVDVLDNDYLNIAYAGIQPEFGIVSPYDNNTITITPTVSTYSGNPAGVPFNIVLDQGETYMVAAGGELTGSIITGSMPIAVFGADLCTNVPAGYCCCDHIVEQLSPVSTWGETFVTRPLSGRNNGDVWRFLASENATQLSINGIVVANLNFGGYYQTVLTASSFVSSNNPILAVQYSTSQDWDGVNSDPFMMIVPPYQQFLGGYVFSTPQSGFATNYFNSSVQNSGVTGMVLDGSPLNPGAYAAIGASGYSVASFPVNINTSHTLSNTSGSPSGLNLYGFDSWDSYGYPGGQAFGAVATVTNLDLTPVNGSAQVGTNQCWQALVTDQFNAPVPGVRVDFTLTGAHTGTSGFGFTDINGVATYCFTGINAGSDVVVANISSHSDTAQFTWTPAGPPVPLSDWAIYFGILLAVGFVVIRYRKMI